MQTTTVPNNGVWVKLGPVSKLEGPTSLSLALDIDPAGIGWARNIGPAPVEVRYEAR